MIPLYDIDQLEQQDYEYIFGCGYCMVNALMAYSPIQGKLYFEEGKTAPDELADIHQIIDGNRMYAIVTGKETYGNIIPSFALQNEYNDKAYEIYQRTDMTVAAKQTEMQALIMDFIGAAIAEYEE